MYTLYRYAIVLIFHPKIFRKKDRPCSSLKCWIISFDPSRPIILYNLLMTMHKIYGVLRNRSVWERRFWLPPRYFASQTCMCADGHTWYVGSTRKSYSGEPPQNWSQKFLAVNEIQSEIGKLSHIHGWAFFFFLPSLEAVHLSSIYWYFFKRYGIMSKCYTRLTGIPLYSRRTINDSWLSGGFHRYGGNF